MSSDLFRLDRTRLRRGGWVGSWDLEEFEDAESFVATRRERHRDPDDGWALKRERRRKVRRKRQDSSLDG